MGLQRRFKLVFTEDTITDEGYVVKEKPTVLCQICNPENMFEQMLIPEKVISEMMLQKLYEGALNELKNPNHQLDQLNNKEKEVKIEDLEKLEAQTIIPLHPENKN